MRNLLIVGLALSISGCAMLDKFRNKGKRETLMSADKELQALTEDRKSDCDLLLTRLRTLRAKVLAELEKVK